MAIKPDGLVALCRITYPRFLGKSLMRYQVRTRSQGKLMRHETDGVM